MKSNPMTEIKINNTRAMHYFYGKEYMWCDWSFSVGRLVITYNENYCDKCKQTLWSHHDPRPSPYRMAKNVGT